MEGGDEPRNVKSTKVSRVFASSLPKLAKASKSEWGGGPSLDHRVVPKPPKYVK